MESNEMAGLDEISMEIGSLKASVSNIQRQQEDAHRAIFNKLDEIGRTVAIGSVEIPAIKKQVDSHDVSIELLQNEKHERKGALWGIGACSAAISGIVTAVGEYIARH